MSPTKRKLPRASEAARSRAIIYIGASSVSMMIYAAGCEPDVLTQPLDVAKDVFHGNKLTRETLDACCRIIEGYQHLIDEYRDAGEVQVRLLGSNILLDVKNLDTVINRLSIASGMRLEVMDDGEMTRLLYMHMKFTLEKHADLQKKRVMVLHVGPGNTRVLLFERGRINYYARYRMGAHRTAEAIGPAELEEADNEAALIREHIRGVVEQIRHDYSDSHETMPHAMIVFGPEFRKILSTTVDPDVTSTEELADLTARVAACNTAKRMERYGMDFATVKSLLPSLVSYLSLAHEFEPKIMLIPDEESRKAFLLNLLPCDKKRSEEQALKAEVLRFSTLLAKRYGVDQSHSEQVQNLCAQLFDQLQDLHKLSQHDRLLLNVGAILHEVGSYINPKRHHHHGQYIILNSELFGLSHTDVEIVGLLARYHRHGLPSTRDHFYAELSEHDRLRVQKLASILRVADAMERAHSHRITQFEVRFSKKRIELVVPGTKNFTLENIALREKGDLFTDIFGYDLLLVNQN